MSATPRRTPTSAAWFDRLGDGTMERAERDADSRRMLRVAAWIGFAALGMAWGAVVAYSEWTALYLCISLIGCVFIVRDFRIGVALLIVLMPISRSWIFPHAMLGVTGLNPFNLLLAGTLGSYLLHGLSVSGLKRFVPLPLFLYLLPIVVAGLVGSLHVGEIPPVIFNNEVIEFTDAFGYLRDLLVKPLLMVLFGLLVGAAVSKSDRPERFLVPAVISIWVMSVMVIVFVAMSDISLREMAKSESRQVLSGLGMHANELGRLYVAGYALLLFVFVESRDRLAKVALLASMALAMIALVLTFSRGAFLSFVLVNVIFVYWRRDAKTAILFGLIAVAVLIAMPGAVYDRITTGFGNGFESGAGVITAGRVEYLWMPLLPEVANSPFFGHGLNSILWSQPMRTGGGITVLPVEHPHNGYLQALLDMGIVGLAFLCAYFVHVWRGFRALGKDPAISPTLRGFYLGSAAALASLLLSYATDSSLTPGPEQSFLWLAVGMMYGHASRSAARRNADGAGAPVFEGAAP